MVYIRHDFFMISSNKSSTLTPSASALKFIIILCLNTDLITDFTSSISGVAFPSNIAFAFAARIKNELALGPAPH